VVHRQLDTPAFTDEPLVGGVVGGGEVVLVEDVAAQRQRGVRRGLPLQGQVGGGVRRQPERIGRIRIALADMAQPPDSVQPGVNFQPTQTLATRSGTSVGTLPLRDTATPPTDSRKSS
jgi:hypothetical protein